MTSKRRPLFVVTTEANARVELYNADDPNGPLLAEGSTNANGRVELQLAQNLGNGTIRLIARVRDSADNAGNPSTPLAVRIVSVLDDYDRDGRADAAVFRPSNRVWSIVGSGGNGTVTTVFDQPGNVPLRGDFDGDGTADRAVWNPTTSTFTIEQSTLGLKVQQLGWGGVDLPAVADYDGDGKTDVAVYSPVGGYIAAVRSTAGGIFYSLDARGGFPISADFDGDFKADPAVFNPATAVWTIQRSTTGVISTTQFGAGTQVMPTSPDVPLPADFDGDGKADFALYRQTSAEWIIRYSGGGNSFDSATGRFLQFGWAGVDVPTPSDYDGDGKADLSVYRPTTGQYFTRLSGGGSQRDPSTGQAPGRSTRRRPATCRSSRPSATAAPGPGCWSSARLDPAAPPARWVSPGSRRSRPPSRRAPPPRPSGPRCPSRSHPAAARGGHQRGHALADGLGTPPPVPQGADRRPAGRPAQPPVLTPPAARRTVIHAPLDPAPPPGRGGCAFGPTCRIAARPRCRGRSPAVLYPS